MGLERYEEALAMYEQALQYPEDSFDTYTGWRNKGLTLSALERYEEALESHDRAIEWYDRSEEEGTVLRDIALRAREQGTGKREKQTVKGFQYL